MKEFKTTIEQINLLKSRGLLFENEFEANNILLSNNYYNIINGYKDLFIKPGSENIFLFGTTFEEIYSLYTFDKNLKDTLLEYILKIENNLRAYIAYYFSLEHGNDNYLKLDNFDNLNDVPSVTMHNKQTRIKNIQDLIGTIHKEIARNIDSKDYIKHYLIKYGFIPLWVLINILSFGKLSIFLELMKQKERIQISKQFNITDNELVQFTKMLAYFRNLCAHDDRIYNVKLPKYLYIPNNEYHTKLKIAKNNNMYKYGKNDLFALLIVLKMTLSKNDFNNLYNKLCLKIKSLEKKLKVIQINDVLTKMNFPANWKDLKKF